MKSEKTIRESGIELLRIYAILSVIVLHYFNAGIGGGSNYVQGTFGNLISHMYLTLAFCAVDLFIMISGYFLSASSKRSFSKIFFLLFEAAIFRTIMYLIQAKSNSAEITFSGIIECAFSVGYFIAFYSVIYFVSPLINFGFNKLDKSNCRKAVIMLFVIFSVISAVEAVLCSYNVCGSDWVGICTVTNSGSFEGYTIVNFFLCYLIGGYIRHWHSDKKKTSKVLAFFAVNTLALLIWGYIDWKSAYTYDNPLVIMEGAWLLILFKDFKFKSKIVNELATSGFTCYLIHSRFLKYINIEKYASGSWYVLLLHVIISAVGIYLVCYLIHKIYSICTDWLVKLTSPVLNKIDLTVYQKEEVIKSDN